MTFIGHRVPGVVVCPYICISDIHGLGEVANGLISATSGAFIR